ncbi:hypothetical protein L1987_74198 [Smallanthus sonchifolius]|uniref:Uncharacterized protein n=1 Tax=Smallanthus sonchifolius TaxID=185202 RepID=A0ACB9A1J4_9ASTR|nr:hypothetical protein L1987_74198 [Smallanthus sonchifolius]
MIMDNSVEFSYEELSTATYEFSLANKIGQGGFGAVYYAELRGEKAAIKKMDMQASRQFLAELRVLTHSSPKPGAFNRILYVQYGDVSPKFDEVLSQADPKDNLVKMIDPMLGDNYPLDSVHKMAQLAKACTHEDPRRRPNMRSVVVALLTLSSSRED